MTRFRLATWPLIVSGVFLIATIAGAVILPGIDPTLTVGGIVVVENTDLITLALGGLTLIFASLSFLLRKGPIDPLGDDTITINRVKEPKASRLFAAKRAPETGDLMAAYESMNPPVENLTEDRAAARAAADEEKQLSREDKARAAQAAKFQKQAQKDAARAEKLAARANKRGQKLTEDVQVDEVSTATANEWIASIHNAHGAVPDVQSEEEAEEGSNERVVYELDDVLVPAPTEDKATPSWLMAAYEDPNFQIPFAQQSAETVSDDDAEAELVVIDEVELVEAPVVLEEAAEEAEEPEAIEIVEVDETVTDAGVADSSEIDVIAVDEIVDDSAEKIDETVDLDEADIAEALAEEDGWDIPEEAAPAKKLGWFARRKAAKAAKAEEAAALAALAEEEIQVDMVEETILEDADETIVIEDAVVEVDGETLLIEETIVESADETLIVDEVVELDDEATEIIAEALEEEIITEESVEVVATPKKRGWFGQKRGKHESDGSTPAVEDSDESVTEEAFDDLESEADVEIAVEEVVEEAPVEIVEEAPVVSKPKKKVRGARRKAAAPAPSDTEDIIVDEVADQVVEVEETTEMIADETVEEIAEEVEAEEIAVEVAALEEAGVDIDAELEADIIEAATEEAIAEIEEAVADADDLVADEPAIVLPFDDVYVAPAPEFFLEVTPQEENVAEPAAEYDIEPATEFIELTEAEKVEAVYEQNRRLEAELHDLREQISLLIESNPRARRAARRNKK